MRRRASIAANRLRAETSPNPSHSLKRRPALAVARGEGEDVGGDLDQPLLEEQLDLLVAEPLDVEGVARAEMLEALDRLRGADEAAGAAAHDVGLAGLLVDLAQRRRAADRADEISVVVLREDVGLRAVRPLVGDDFEDLRDDVAGALDDDRVADPHVEPRDLVLVVQRGVGDDDAADGDGLELGDRRQRAGAADLDLDRFDDRRRRSAGNLCATAQRGLRETKPSRCCSARSSTL